MFLLYKNKSTNSLSLLFCILSISSSAISKKAEVKSKPTEVKADESTFSTLGTYQEDASASGGRRKFNLKELMNNPKSKPKTHRNNSFKNKKSRVFYNRTKKNV